MDTNSIPLVQGGQGRDAREITREMRLVRFLVRSLHRGVRRLAMKVRP